MGAWRGTGMETGVGVCGVVGECGYSDAVCVLAGDLQWQSLWK